MIGINKDEVIFIDDKQSYVNGAKEVGIPALLYTTTDKLKQDLAKNGVQVSYFVPLAQRLTCLVYNALSTYIDLFVPQEELMPPKYMRYCKPTHPMGGE